MSDFLPASLQGSFGFRSTSQAPCGPVSCPLSCPVSSPDSPACGTPPVSHWYRLFVGWVPRQYKESDLQPIFDKCGEVKDIIILKDKVSGQPKGCAFVSYATEAEAKKAIAELDRKIQLSGASSPMEVRFARSHQYIQAGTGPQDNRQLFFSRAPTTATEEDFKKAFSKFGKVVEINVFTDRKSCMSKGCGFVTMASRNDAVSAIENMNDLFVMPGATTSLAVKWADPDLQSKKKKAVEEANADKRMTTTPSKESPSPFPSTDRWLTREGMDNEVIAKILDAQLQKKRREEQLAATMREAQQSRNSGGRICRMPGTNALYTVPPGATLVTAQPHAVRRLDYTHDVPPLGCQSDAIKLFVGNIPKTYTADNLRPLFDQIGTVIELVVVRDKLTDESKGSAFVWYQTRCEAERAIAELHLRHILHDPTGEQDRPLVVRRANPKVPPVLLQAAAAVMPQTSPATPTPVQSFQQPPVMPPMMDSSLDFPAHLQGSFMPPETLGLDPNPSSSISRLSSDFNSMSLLPFNTRKVEADPPLASKPAVNVSGLDLNVQSLLGTQPLETVDSGLSSPFDFLSPSDAFPSPAGSNTSTPQSNNFQMSSVNPSMPLQQNMVMGQMTLALPISPQQGSVIGANLHNIQVTSGALIQLAPGANNSYVVMLSGNESQVNTAKAVVQDLITV